MNPVYVPILLAWTALLLFHSPAFSDIRLPIPSATRNLNKQNAELLQLKRLLDEDSIIPFYQEADKMLKEASLYRKKKCHSTGIDRRPLPVPPDCDRAIHRR